MNLVTFRIVSIPLSIVTGRVTARKVLQSVPFVRVFPLGGLNQLTNYNHAPLVFTARAMLTEVLAYCRRRPVFVTGVHSSVAASVNTDARRWCSFIVPCLGVH